MTLIKIEGSVGWKCFRATGGNWVGICEPLGLTLQSETWGTLMDDIDQTLNAILLDLLKSQELEHFLHARGWRPMGRIPERPDDIRFDLPFTTSISDRDSQVSFH